MGSGVRADRKVGGRADAEAPDHWRSTQVSLIQDKLTDHWRSTRAILSGDKSTSTAVDRAKAIDRVKGARQSPGPT